MKSLGIIGGLGPMATAYLLQLIIEMTDAKTDQEHLDVIVFDRPSVPDRTSYILDPLFQALWILLFLSSVTPPPRKHHIHTYC